MRMPKDVIRLNVGGKLFVTSSTTLANAGSDSMLSAMIGDYWRTASCAPAAEDFFIDRNPAYFSVLLDLLRTGELHVPPGISERALHREALFYGILDHVRAAKWGPLDGNRLECVNSIRGRATGDATAIRAAQDGGCCVARGPMVHVYDWSMEEQTPLTLDYVNVNDAGFLNPQRVVICTCERGDKTGGMALFNVKTGRLEHKYEVCHHGQQKNCTAGAVAISDASLFASCRGRSNEYGIGCWDQTTGKLTDFLYEGHSGPLGDACKLQWLPHSSMLMVAALYPLSDDSFISFLDMRSNSVVWSWTDADKPIVGDEKVVMDAIAMDECSTVCVVNQFDNLGFIDTRASNQGVRWRDHYKPGKISEAEEHCYSKLAVWGSQLFSSKGDSVYVFCTPDLDAARCVQTAKLRKSEGGEISDISVGGERLFVLHNEEDVFDVWETSGFFSMTNSY
ncbi:hypothetical protein GOP47_0017258 [Adiantum capillus-veneris]|uniref:BTB domain-containing protein n=1 Tax=Adiantum capillus-veneris TaxID=13818 RepID=A0A9D4UK69_ADICA|nr:hypothetical protein GOP47_0017258 [Adiantum capillus-veneris]